MQPSSPEIFCLCYGFQDGRETCHLKNPPTTQVSFLCFENHKQSHGFVCNNKACIFHSYVSRNYWPIFFGNIYCNYSMSVVISCMRRSNTKILQPTLGKKVNNYDLWTLHTEDVTQCMELTWWNCADLLDVADGVYEVIVGGTFARTELFLVVDLFPLPIAL